MSRFGLELRAATAADAPGLQLLLAEAGHSMDPRVVAERLDALRHDAGAALIAVQWGPPSGLVSMHWHHTLWSSRPTARITTLLVAAEDRRRGIGRLLVKAAAQAARTAGCETLELAVAPGVPSLLGFCAATGFVETGASFQRLLRKQS